MLVIGPCEAIHCMQVEGSALVHRGIEGESKSQLIAQLRIYMQTKAFTCAHELLSFTTPCTTKACDPAWAGKY